MEEMLWFAFGSVAGFALRGRGRAFLLLVATTSVRAGDTISGAASTAVRQFSTLTARPRKSAGAFLAEARENARGAGQRPLEQPSVGGDGGLGGRARALLTPVAGAAGRAGHMVSSAATQAANRLSSLAARPRERMGALLASVRSKARGPEARPPEKPSGEAEIMAPA
jgi:hypothetical protein